MTLSASAVTYGCIMLLLPLFWPPRSGRMDLWEWLSCLCSWEQSERWLGDRVSLIRFFRGTDFWCCCWLFSLFLASKNKSTRHTHCDTNYRQKKERKK
jgi:hypothetical protein